MSVAGRALDEIVANPWLCWMEINALDSLTSREELPLRQRQVCICDGPIHVSGLPLRPTSCCQFALARMPRLGPNAVVCATVQIPLEPNNRGIFVRQRGSIDWRIVAVLASMAVVEVQLALTVNVFRSQCPGGVLEMFSQAGQLKRHEAAFDALVPEDFTSVGEGVRSAA